MDAPRDVPSKASRPVVVAHSLPAVLIQSVRESIHSIVYALALRSSISCQLWSPTPALCRVFESFCSLELACQVYMVCVGLALFMQVLPWTKKTATTIMHKIRTLFLSWDIEKSSLIALRCAAMREVAASRATVPIS